MAPIWLYASALEICARTSLLLNEKEQIFDSGGGCNLFVGSVCMMLVVVAVTFSLIGSRFLTVLVLLSSC